MQMNRFLQILLAAGVLAGCTGIHAADVSSMGTAQTAKQFKVNKGKNGTVNYLLFLPKDYAKKSGKTWPLILFLHGSGERGSNVWKVATHGPPSRVAAEPDFPFIIVSPQCPEGEHWSNDTLLALLDEVLRNYAADPARVYLTGLSMGGYGTWDLGLSHPERFAAIVPICGGGEMISVLLSSREKAEALKRLGIWAFHGAKDPVVPVEESQRMVDAANKAGVTEAKLTVYPEAEHNSWTQTYNNPELYDWLLKHRSGGVEKP